MIFELSREELTAVFGEEGVHRVSARAAESAGFTGETLAFLTGTGLPDNQFVSFPELDGPDAAFQPVPVEELGATWNLPAAAADWVFFCNFEISAVVADTRTGELHQLAEGIMRPIPLHGDISSLVHTISALTTIVTSLPEDYDDEEDALEAVQESLDGLKAAISQRDPRPFRDEHSEWTEIVTHIGAGMWSSA